jgi:signal transduction histidine kinase
MRLRDISLTPPNPAIAWCLAAAAAAGVLCVPLPAPYVLGAVTLVLLTAVALAPFRSWHAAALGLSVEIVYFLSSQWAISSIDAQRTGYYIFFGLLTAVATAVTASRHARRNAWIAARQEAIRSAEALTGAQLRAQLAENAISIGKMAAALSHEINSPLGALRSSIETLVAIAARKDDVPEPVRELIAGIQRSAARIDEVAHRLRRFENLEEADLKSADLNELLMDVTQMYEAEIHERKVRVDFDLERSLPMLSCRPQLLTAAFSSMLCNAIQAVNGDGRVRISTHLRELEVEVVIRDNGRGMPPELVDTMFEPSFKVTGERISSGNWSLFNARQIVYEHGGAITVETVEGAGTSVRVSLPVTGRYEKTKTLVAPAVLPPVF